MNLGKDNHYGDLQNVQDQCKKYLNYHIILTTTDGKQFDGIIQNVDSNGINMMTGEDVQEQESENNYNKQRVYYNYDYDYDRPRRRYRHFRRRRFPYNTLASIALLPYIAPPLYPYYPYF